MAIDNMVVGAVKHFSIDDAVLKLQLPPDDLDVLASELPEEPKEGEEEGLKCSKNYCQIQYCEAGYAS